MFLSVPVCLFPVYYLFALNSHLEVPVYDSILVAMVDALQNLLDAVGRIRLRIELAGDNVLKQFAARYSAENKEKSKH